MPLKKNKKKNKFNRATIALLLTTSTFYPRKWSCTSHHSPQFSSSLPSEQSFEWSHLQAWRMQWPFLHGNSDAAHLGDACGRVWAKPHNSSVSSRPSLQSVCLSQTLFLGRQASDGPQEKKPAVQFMQEASSLPSAQSSTPLHKKSIDMHLLLWQANSPLVHHTWPVKSHS